MELSGDGRDNRPAAGIAQASVSVLLNSLLPDLFASAWRIFIHSHVACLLTAEAFVLLT